MLKDLGKRANINNMHPHILRHSRAIAMLRGGAKPFVVQQHLGHKSITTTMNIYGMFMASDLKAEIPQW
jgi:site-specific recombinase XerD